MITTDLLIIKASHFIADLEGFREYAYKDSAGIWTYGFGFTKTPNGNKVTEFDRITKDRAVRYLRDIILIDYQHIYSAVRVRTRTAE